MANYILLIFEGARSERIVWTSMQKFYLQDLKDTIIYGIYGCEIYSLYHKMTKDPDLDLFTLLKNAPGNIDLLAKISKDDVSEIFLFFDYDGHAPTACDKKLLNMLECFDEETENGKLYISYPMVEALKHLNANTPFHEVVIECKTNINYKGLVSRECNIAYNNLTTINKNDWNFIIGEHCKKLNHLMNDDYSLPTEYYSPTSTFEKQVEKHITPENKIAVLSAFPIFILDYYGTSKIAELLL